MEALEWSHIFAYQTEKSAAVKHHLNEQTSRTAITLEDQLLGGVAVEGSLAQPGGAAYSDFAGEVVK